MKIVEKNQVKIVIFTAVKNRCILHGHVFVMMSMGATYAVLVGHFFRFCEIDMFCIVAVICNRMHDVVS